MWTNNEGQYSPMNHGHNANYIYMTQHNRSDSDDSTLTPIGSSSVSGESYWSKTVGKDRHEPDSHTLYPLMTEPHAIPHLSNR